MSEAFEVTIREAEPADALALLKFTKKVALETEFLVMDELGIVLTEELLALQLADLAESDNNLLLLAFVGEELVGNASVKASSDPLIRHIGEVGISILKEYWHLGLGTILLKEIIYWAQEMAEIFRLELTVQTRNQRAIQLYQKMGFEKEASMARGARSQSGEFLTVDLMSLLIH